MKRIKFLAALLCASVMISCKDDKVEIKSNSFELVPSSKATWKGTLVGGPSNEGTITLTGGGFTLVGEKLMGGAVNIAVNTIDVTTPLPAAEKTFLMDHLRSTDFFSMILHPTVTYNVASVEKLPTVDAAGNNYKILGALKLLGATFPLEIPAKVTITANKVTVKSTFKFDRTIWGMTYASVTAPPQGGLIEKDVQVTIDLVAEKK